MMLTGDNKDTARAVADELNLSDFRAGMLPEDKLKEVDRLKSEDEGVVEAQICSAFPLEGQELEQIISLLSKRYEKNISPTVDVDSDLIGGITVQVGDKVWDASVRGRLQEMATALTK